jgi:hypothetical protein
MAKPRTNGALKRKVLFRPVREFGTVAAVFAALTCALTYPQISDLSSHVGPHYDALFGVWRLAWVAHQLPHDPARLFDANIFSPESNTLAYSDAVLLLGIVGAPFIWVGADPVVVYNIFVLLSFVAAGTAMYALARTLTGSAAAGWVAGLSFAFQPYRVAHFAQIELLWTCWIPLAILALHRLIMTRHGKWGLALGVAISCQALTSLYYAVFLVTGLMVLLPLQLRRGARQKWSSILVPLAVSAAVVVSVCLPYALPYVKAQAIIGTRSIEEVREWSPTLQNYVSTPPSSLLYRRLPENRGLEGIMFPGLVVVTLAGVGLVAARRDAMAFGVLLLVTFDLSLGVNGFLYPAARWLLPPYQGLRVPGRMFVMVSAALAVLAAYGLRALLANTGRTGQRSAVLIVAGALVIEGLAVPLPLHAIPKGPSRIYQFLAAQPPAIVLEWPLPEPHRLGYTREPERMYFSTFHWQRLVNGYSGHYPASYMNGLHVLQRFPDAASLEHLRQQRVRYVVLHSVPNPALYRDVVYQLERHRDVEVLMTDHDRIEGGTLIRIRGI